MDNIFFDCKHFQNQNPIIIIIIMLLNTKIEIYANDLKYLDHRAPLTYNYIILI